MTLPGPKIRSKNINVMTRRYDYLVIGSGIAGMSFALKAARRGHKVAIICKTTLEEANTYYAQGGVASVTNLEVDDFDKHIHDTMVAGDWLSDPAAVEKVVRNAPSQIRELVGWGVDFDKKADGNFDLTAREDTPNSASSTMPTTPAPRSSSASSGGCAPTRTSTSSTITSPSRSSPSIIWAKS